MYMPIGVILIEITTDTIKKKNFNILLNIIKIQIRDFSGYRLSLRVFSPTSLGKKNPKLSFSSDYQLEIPSN